MMKILIMMVMKAEMLLMFDDAARRPVRALARLQVWGETSFYLFYI